MKSTKTTVIKTAEDLDCWKKCRMLRLFIAVMVLNGYMHYLKTGSGNF